MNSELGMALQAEMDALKDKASDLDYTLMGDEEKQFFKFRKPIHDPLVTGYNYLFVTAPDLPIDAGASSLRQGPANASFFDTGVSGNAKEILERNRRMLQIAGSSMYTNEMVKWLAGAHGDQFIPILTNRARSYTSSDEVLNTMDYAETWNRYKIILGTSAKDSRISGVLTINYQEDQFLTIMKMHKLWFTYIEKAFLGECISGGVLLSDDMMDNMQRTIDYMSSVYMFSTLPDGETLTHWSKYTGILPVKGPWSEFTSEDGGKQELKDSIPIDYQFTFKESMTLDVLRDFNLLQAFAEINDPKGDYFVNSVIDISKTPINKARPYIAKAPQYEGKNLFKLVMPETK
jgi:hypothetical protein